jgi:hypothetical protein
MIPNQPSILSINSRGLSRARQTAAPIYISDVAYSETGTPAVIGHPQIRCAAVRRVPEMQKAAPAKGGFRCKRFEGGQCLYIQNIPICAFVNRPALLNL